MVYDSKRIYRILLFDVYELNLKQITSLKSKTGFIVHIYVLVFVKANPTQTLPYAPHRRPDEGFWGASFC